MSSDRKVRIFATSINTTFTQRGSNSARGFVRLRTEKGRDTLITGEAYDGIFYPAGKNRNVPVELEDRQLGIAV